MFEALDRVVLAVRDLEAATRRYAQLLGRGPAWRGERPGRGTRDSLFRLDSAALELVAPAGPGPAAERLASRLEAGGDGLLALVLRTPDAEACRERLAGAALAPEAVTREIGRDVDSGGFFEERLVALSAERTRGVALFAVERVSPDAVLPPSALLCEARAAVSDLDHAVIVTPRPEEARALYGGGLGLRLALDRSFPQWGQRLLFFRVGGVTLELAAALESGPAEPTRDRLWGLSYRVGDAEAARARLAAAGFDVSPVRDGRRPGTRVFSVRDGTCGVPSLMLQ